MTSKDKFFSNKLLEWYEKNQRELPWRKNIRHKDYPYRVLVSEFMLQQTTVATVVPYFKKFIKEWPTLKKLSHAKIEDVLLFWQGLGYYSRAKNLLQTVKIIDKDYNGKIPKDKIIAPGVIDSTTNFVEHPEVVKNRIVTYSKVIEKDQLIAGTDCGFSTFAGFGNVDENIVYKKLESLVRGAELASKVI